jgi:hypothetical protein
VIGVLEALDAFDVRWSDEILDEVTRKRRR